MKPFHCICLHFTPLSCLFGVSDLATVPYVHRAPVQQSSIDNQSHSTPTQELSGNNCPLTLPPTQERDRISVIPSQDANEVVLINTSQNSRERGGERRKRKEELRNRKEAQWFKNFTMNWSFLLVSDSQVLQVRETSGSFHWKLEKVYASHASPETKH